MKIKNNISIYIIPVILLFFNAIMLIFPKEIFFGAKNGLLLWFEKVIPSILPFMIISNCLISVDIPQFLGQLTEPFTLAVFNLTGTEAFPLILGLTAGCPIGIKTTSQLYKNGSLTENAAKRLTMFCGNAGALFITGTVGMGVFKSAKAGYFLMLCTYIPPLFLAVITGLFSPRTKPKKVFVQPKPFTQKIFTAAIADSLRSVLMIGGYIIIFSVICAVFEKLHIFDGLSLMLRPLGLPESINKALASGFFEMTNGCALANGSGKLSIACAAMILGWSGLSIHAQSLEFTESAGIDCRYFFCGRFICSILSFTLAYFMYDLFI